MRGCRRVRALRWSVLVGVCAALLAVMLLAPVAQGASGVDISVIEGQSFTGKVTDIGGCSLVSATISWGDGSTSAGSSDGGTGIQGTHTYAEEGTSSALVSFSSNPTRFCAGGTQMASFQATVQDAPLTATGVDSSGVAGSSLTAVRAHVNDANPAAGAGDLSAHIAWGDGATSAGTVAAAPSGGYVVSGTHTYAGVGSYQISTTITDVGGATTTTSSTASIGTPLPPPLPQARFGFAPFSPCQNDQVSFDASSSTGGGAGRPITKYDWSIDESAFTPTQFTSAVPTFTHVFPAASYSVGPYRGPLQNSGDLSDYHFFRPPAKVTLQVTDSSGKTATLSRTITFVDPDELLVGAAYVNHKTGLPGVSFLRDARFSDVVPCQAHSLDPKSTVVKLALPTFPYVARLVLPRVGPHRAALALKTRCRTGLFECSGELVVSQAVLAPGRTHIQASRVHRLLAGSLGHATFFIPAGHLATVIVRLNARGRAPARLHALGRLTLSLLTSRAHGGIDLASRTIIILTGRTNRQSAGCPRGLGSSVC